MTFNSPFASSVATSGKGEVVLAVLPPANPVLKTLTYKYPLKLLSRSPSFFPEQSVLAETSSVTKPIHLYLLTYGGGLLPGDHIDVSITLDPRARLVVTTPQGSTKIFKTVPAQGNTTKDQETSTPNDDRSRQTLNVFIGSQAGLCYLPDPSVPFKDSRYEQIQLFTIDGSQKDKERSSFCALDWVTQGRTSRGENWDFSLWKGRSEVWSEDRETGKRRLLLRDAVILDDESGSHPPKNSGTESETGGLIRERTYPHGIIGTLILYGPIFDQLGSFIMNMFTSQPRIGGRNWSSAPADASVASVKQSQVVWTAARVRAGFVLVKFGAKDFETAREWLGQLIREEGSIAREFGEEALICL
ncbi:UreD urease accessory protein-domain-containing protein [Talaromyces proteolyticus]|uniref:UreD urease accessory protein-domain-containing protein n=1 Tax=Talaromyces proteolyticus TaxID=1131652 RepID=A0AAD4PXQ8_9EURO|nr:UreD urease accessory protein-domain-containing protein [Talaromyces proteolyticus]KAH8696664.1 UreD urease accessory protein-domain-containing protein [Talaromyces proteolyticus]